MADKTQTRAVKVGDQMPERVVSNVAVSDFVKYAGAGGDFNPIHHDPAFAALAGQESVFAMGMWQAGVLGMAVADWLGAMNTRRFGTRFRERVWPGDEITCKGTVTAVREEAGERLADLELEVVRQNGSIAVQGWATYVVD